MLKKLLLVCGLALCFAVRSHAQSGYELSCSPPYTVFPNGISTTSDYVTQKFRQWLCLNPSNGSVLIQDGVSAATSAPNILDVYVTPDCNGQPNCFTANPDLIASKNCVFSAINKTVTNSTDSPWVSGDAGKNFWGVYTPNKTSIINSANGITTIAAVNSSSQITLADFTINQGGTFPCAWFTADQTSIFQSAQNYITLSSIGKGYIPYTSPDAQPLGIVKVAGGNYKVSSWILDWQPLVSNTKPISMVGAGETQTKFFIGPDFTSSDAGTTALINERNIASPVLKDFSIQGMQIGMGSGANIPIVTMSNVGSPEISHIQIQAVATTNGTNGALLSLNSASDIDVHDVVLAGNGSTAAGGWALICNACSGTIAKTYFGNSRRSSLWVNSGGIDSQSAPLVLFNDLGDECDVGTLASCHASQHSVLNIVGGTYYGEGPAWDCDANTTLFTGPGTNIGAFNSAVNVSALSLASGCKIYSHSTSWRGNGTSAVFSGPGSGSASFFDGGNNIYQNCNSVPSCSPTGNISSGNMAFFGSSSITGVTQTAGNITPTGWGTGASVSAVSGDSQTENFTVTIGTGPGANATVAVVFPRAFPTAPICSASHSGGTSTTILPIQITTGPTATGVTLTYVGTFVSGTVTTTLRCD